MIGSAAAMAARGANIAAHLQRVNPWRFRQLVGQVGLAYACLRDVAGGRYRLPWRTAAALIAALAYFLAPVDGLSDLIPLVGFVDDAAVFATVFTAAEADLRAYCDWRGLGAALYFGKADS